MGKRRERSVRKQSKGWPLLSRGLPAEGTGRMESRDSGREAPPRPCLEGRLEGMNQTWLKWGGASGNISRAPTI